MINIARHDILERQSKLCEMIEEFPASEHQTATITLACEIMNETDKLIDELEEAKNESD